MKTYKNIQISNIFKSKNINKKATKLLIFYFVKKLKKVLKNMLTIKKIGSIINSVPYKKRKKVH